MTLLEVFNEVSVKPQNIKELKDLILSLAIQGKLTAQWRQANPNVEPASELLKKIEAEKQQLIAEKKIKKEKPLPTVGEDEIPFELPQGWAWSRFDEVILLQMGQSPPSISYNDEGIGEILINGPVEFSNGDHGITKEMKYTSAPTKMCNKGDLIVCIRASIGRTNIASNRACIGRGVASITSFIEFNYIHNYILINKATLFDLGTGTTFRSVSKDPIRNMLIPVPPLEEQKEIVRVVNELFQEIDNLSSKLDLALAFKEDFTTSALRELTTSSDVNQTWNALQQQFNEFFDSTSGVKKLRETILELAVQGKLTANWRDSNPDVEPASKLLKRIEAKKQQLIAEKKIKKEKPLPPIEEDEKPYELPKGWVWCRLRDLVSILGDGIHGTPTYTPNGPVYFINGNNLSDGVIEIKPNTKTVSEEEASKHYRELNERTVLVSINGTIGNTAFYNEEKVMLGKSACYFNLMKELNKQYIRQLLKTNYFINYAMNSATGTTIKNVSLRTMREFMVPLPSKNEQQVIVEKVNSLMALCDQLEELITFKEEQGALLMKSCVAEALG